MTLPNTTAPNPKDPTMTDLPREFRIMHDCWTMIEQLSREERERVFQYLAARGAERDRACAVADVGRMYPLTMATQASQLSGKP